MTSPAPPRDPNYFDPYATPRIEEVTANYDRVALILQGGGALGAYQVGVYKALAEAGAEPDWISGVSIGAINAAIIAGNRPADRLDRLEQFWSTVSGRTLWSDHLPEWDVYRQLRNRMSAMLTLSGGAPGFFTPRQPNPWLLPPGAPGATSFYDTGALRDTLERLVDFDILNNGEKRISLGAVKVRTGNLTFFDSANMRLGPEHVMASGALPPGLPAVKIDGEDYWDGGLVSNTPLQHLLAQEEEMRSLVFQVDLFSARGMLPRDMDDVLTRQKDILYSSRTRQNTDSYRHIHDLKLQLREALKRVPPDQLTPLEKIQLERTSAPASVNIIHLIYQQKTYESQAKDYEFSAVSMREHIAAGCEDTRKTLHHRQWLEPLLNDECIVVHDVHREESA